MTKNDFEVVAKILQQPATTLEYKQKEKLARQFASAFEVTYPLFDRTKFLDACGVAR